MNAIMLNLSSVKTSSTDQYAHISLMPTAHTSGRESDSPSPAFITLAGFLTKGRWLTHPIVVKIETDDDEFVVSELKYYIHGEGPTLSEATEAFKRIFSGYLDILSEEENNLSPYLREQLEYLRSAIRME